MSADIAESGSILAETIRNCFDSNFNTLAVARLAFNLGYWDSLHRPDGKLLVDNDKYKEARQMFNNKE